MTGGQEGAMTVLHVAPDARPPVEVSDEALVDRLRGGDAPAGETLCKRHHEPLMRYLQRLVGNDAAEELFQQTWLSVLDHIDRFNPASNAGAFKAWLFRIATNKANDHWRSGGRERAGREGLRLVTESLGPAASHRMEGAERNSKLQRALDQLPENQRQVLLLRYYSDMKFIEIAEMLGCPLNTALGRVHKGLLKLRQSMADEG
jgi:RNA polymerase sigma-70 factor (ECF subfamily)